MGNNLLGLGLALGPILLLTSISPNFIFLFFIIPLISIALYKLLAYISQYRLAGFLYIAIFILCLAMLVLFFPLSALYSYFHNHENVYGFILGLACFFSLVFLSFNLIRQNKK